MMAVLTMCDSRLDYQVGRIDHLFIDSDPEKFSRETVARQLKAFDDQFN